MRKILFFILLFISLNLYSQEKDDKPKNNMAIEFTTGIGATYSAVWCYYDYKHSYTLNRSPYISDYFDLPPYYSFTFSIPNSFVFYPFPFAGFGIIHSIECGFYLYPPTSIIIPAFKLQNKFKIINKFGNILNKRNWFLFEYGILFLYSIDLLRQDLIIDYFGVGPSIFIGYEKNPIKTTGYSFSIGFVFEGIYINSNLSTNILKIKTSYYTATVNMYDWNFIFGIETRFRFSFIKELKRK